MRHAVVGTVVGLSLLGPTLVGQAPAKVDFGRDVQPILREQCYGCHGPSQQLNNFRLDRRRDALRGGTFPVIAPFNSDGSRFYQRLIGSRFGTQMPPTAPLPAEQVATLKAWIDQGAVWPDEFAGDVPPPVADPDAVKLMAAIRDGDRAEFDRLLRSNPESANLTDERGSTPLLYAALYGDRSTVQALLNVGADPNRANPGGATPLMWAVTDLGKTQALLDGGAYVDARSDDARTAILIAAGLYDGQPVVNRLLAYGANPDVILPTDTLAPLREAARVGDADTFQALLAYGANSRGAGAPPPAFVRANCPKCAELLNLGPAPPPAPAAQVAAPAAPAAADFTYAAPPTVDIRRDVPMSPAAIQTAMSRSIPLLQKNDVAFTQKSGCVSCHQNSLAALAVATARQNGFKVDDTITQKQAKAIAAYAESWRDRALQGIGIPGNQDTVGYIVFGLIASGYPGDQATDAHAYYLKTRQLPNGQWRLAARRPPIESNDIEVTAIAMRVLQVYAPKARKAEYAQAVDRARDWLVTAKGDTTEERAFKLLGLSWAGAPASAIQSAAEELLADQQMDGGWAQTSALTSDAYATGEALVALRQSGAVKPSDAAYTRGATFLLGTQFDDGSWHVKSRTSPIQAPFESGFPHGKDQWISAAGTAWATTALALSR